MSCALTGTGGTCSTVPAGTGSAEPVHGPGRAQLRHRRHLRRHRRLPPLPERHSCAAATCSAGSYTPERDLQRHRHLPDGGADLVRRVQLRHRRHLPHHLHDQRGLRRAQHLQRRPVHARSRWARRARARPSAPRASASRASAAAPAAPAPAGRARSRAAPAPAPSPPSDSRPAEPVRGQRRRQLRHRRDVRRHRRLPPVRDRHGVRWRRRARGSTFSPARTCNGTGTCQTTSLSIVRSLPVRHRRRLPHDVRDVRRLHQPEHLPGRQLRQEADRRRLRRRRRMQLEPLRAGRLLRDRLRRHLPVVRAGRDRRHLRVDRRRRRSRSTSAPIRARRPAAPTAPATAAAPAAATPAAPPARRRRCSGTIVHARPHLRRRRRLRRRVGHHLRRLRTAAPRGACLMTCTADADCVAPNVCTGGQLRQAPQRRGVHDGGRVRSGLLRAGRLLPDRLHRELPLVRAGGTAGDVHAWWRPAPTRSGSAPTAAPRPAAPTAPATAAGACRLYASGTICVAASCSGIDVHAARAPATAPAPARRRRRTSCGTYTCATERVPDVVHGRRATAPAPNVCVTGVCTKKPTGVACAAGGECMTGFCAQGVCCGDAPARGTCQSCALAGTLGTCTNVPTGQRPAATSARDQARDQLRERRHVQRRRRLPLLRRGDAVRGARPAPARR